MTLGLDFDGTYTRDPAFWDRFIVLALARGHTVVCVTMRHARETIQIGCPVIYTGRKAKRPVARENGTEIDIWIDDEPGYIFSDAVA